MAEPVLRDDALDVAALKESIDSLANSTAPFEGRLLKLMHRWKSSQYPDTLEMIAENPMTNYNERDLFQFVNASGFTRTRLELHLETVQMPQMSWAIFLDLTPHPWARPLRAVFDEQFSFEEREFFEKTIRPSIEREQHTAISRMAYVTAQK